MAIYVSSENFFSDIPLSYWEGWFEACYEEMQDQISKAKGDKWVVMNSMFFTWISMKKGIMVRNEDGFFQARMLGCSVRDAGKHAPFLFQLIDFGGL